MKSMRRRLTAATMASAVCIGALAGCGASESGSAAANDYSIDVVLKAASSEYWQAVTAGAQQAGEDLGVGVDVKGPSSETAYDEQSDMIQTDLNSGSYDAMVIAPLQGDTTAELVSYTNVPIFALDTGFDSDKVISFIGTDNEEAASKGGAAAVKAAQDAGWDEINAIAIGGIYGESSCTARLTGYKEGIESAGGTMLIDETKYAESLSDNAVSCMEAIMLDHPDGVAIIVCHNDETAIAAAHAAKSNEAYANTVFVGFDGNQTAYESILDGEETITVTQNAYDMGYKAVETAVASLDGQIVDEFVDSGTDVIDESSAQDRLDSLTEQLKAVG